MERNNVLIHYSNPIPPYKRKNGRIIKTSEKVVSEILNIPSLFDLASVSIGVKFNHVYREGKHWDRQQSKDCGF